MPNLFIVSSNQCEAEHIPCSVV